MAIGNVMYTPAPALRQSDVVDNLLSTATSLPGSANQLRVLDEKLKNLSNENLLKNGDFRINQTGFASYYTEWGYTVDMWRAFGVITTPVTGGVNLKPKEGAEYYGFLQYIPVCECPILDNVVNCSITIDGAIHSNFGIPRIGFSVVIDTTIRVDVTYNTEIHSVVVQIYGNSEMTVNWIKLEFGSIATAFIPPNYFEELRRCQLYYEVGNRYTYIPYEKYIDCRLNFTVPIELKISTDYLASLGERVRIVMSRGDVFAVPKEELKISVKDPNKFTVCWDYAHSSVYNYIESGDIDGNGWVDTFEFIADARIY